MKSNNGTYLIIGTLLSWLIGYLGADRYYRNEVLLGLLKLVTFGGFGIWYLVDAIIWTVELGRYYRQDD